jgi:hypothetical protein
VSLPRSSGLGDVCLDDRATQRQAQSLGAADAALYRAKSDKPTRVSVDRTSEDTERGLEIVDEEGVRTRVAFRTTATPEMLDGLAPAEI